MKYLVFLFYWIALTERFTIEGIIVGSAIGMLVIYFNRENLICFKSNKFKYWAEFISELLKEIIISNIHVAKIVLSRRIDISPGFFKVKTKLKKDFYRVILANSITLTPGTLTITLEEDEMLVHCLEGEQIEGIQNSNLEKIIMKVEE